MESSFRLINRYLTFSLVSNNSRSNGIERQITACQKNHKLHSSSVRCLCSAANGKLSRQSCRTTRADAAFITLSDATTGVIKYFARLAKQQRRLEYCSSLNSSNEAANICQLKSVNPVDIVLVINRCKHLFLVLSLQIQRVTTSSISNSIACQEYSV